MCFYFNFSLAKMLPVPTTLEKAASPMVEAEERAR